MQRDKAAHPLGQRRILDPQHHLEIEVETAHVEIGAADIDGVVDHDQLHVQFAGFEFVNLRPLLQEVMIERTRGPDGRRVIGPAGRDQPRLAA